ncbi:MAG: hypothetical protein QNJ51_15535 [Calothrix sp. MO_167.B12]|nr:hypothetical protein [Calothrix sp. MO_167.B12]
MKTNTLHFVSFFCTSLAIALVILGTIVTAKAQNTLPNLNQSVLNGLFSPTAAERFFEEGRRKMDKETQILVNPEAYKREDILQINTTDIKKIEETGKTKPVSNSPEDSSR